MVDKTLELKLSELGVTGLRHQSGYIYEENLDALSGQLKWRVYAEMRDNNAVVGSILFAIEMLMRNVPWKVIAANKTPDAIMKQEFVKSNLEDMNRPWSETISEIAQSMLPMGHAPMEQVFKHRNGIQPLQFEKPLEERIPSSVHNDGLVGWHKFALRAPETVNRWRLADNGEIEGLYQLAPPRYIETFIPFEKLLLFRTTSFKNNPEGRSILRNAYRPHYFQKRIENIEGIGVERDLAGLPVALVPPELLSPDATPEQKATLEEVKRIVTNIRRDEQEGVVFPSAYDKNGNLLYDLKLLSTGGSRQFKTDEIIKRYRVDTAIVVLADFVLMGHEKVGTEGLANSKTSIFNMALGSWLKSISDVINRDGIPLLFTCNGFSLDNMPLLVPEDIENTNLDVLGRFITALNNIGVDLTGDEVGNHLKAKANIPSERNEEV